MTTTNLNLTNLELETIETALVLLIKSDRSPMQDCEIAKAAYRKIRDANAYCFKEASEWNDRLAKSSEALGEEMKTRTEVSMNLVPLISAVDR